MIESILQGLGIFFYWVGIILCVLLAYTIPVWWLTRHERTQLRLEREKIEASKAEFAKQLRAQEIFDKAQNCMNSAYQKQTEAMADYKAALLAIDKSETIRQQAEIKVETLDQKNQQLRSELEHSRERTKRLARKLQAERQKHL